MLRERHRTRPRYGPYFDVLPPPPPPDEEGQWEDARAVAPGEEGLQRGVASGGGWQPSCVEEFPAEAVEALAGSDLVGGWVGGWGAGRVGGGPVGGARTSQGGGVRTGSPAEY